MNILEKITLKNKTHAVNAVNLFIQDFITFAYTELQDIWKTKKDGSFYADTALVVTQWIAKNKRELEDYYKRNYKIDDLDINAYISHNDKTNFTLVVTANYQDTTRDDVTNKWYEQFRNHLFVYKNSPEWNAQTNLEKKNEEFIRDQHEKYPLRTPGEVRAAQRHYTKLKNEIDSLREKKREYAHNFGSEFLSNKI